MSQQSPPSSWPPGMAHELSRRGWKCPRSPLLPKPQKARHPPQLWGGATTSCTTSQKTHTASLAGGEPPNEKVGLYHDERGPLPKEEAGASPNRRFPRLAEGGGLLGEGQKAVVCLCRRETESMISLGVSLVLFDWSRCARGEVLLPSSGTIGKAPPMGPHAPPLPHRWLSYSINEN
jgi:hypothetical protein